MRNCNPGCGKAIALSVFVASMTLIQAIAIAQQPSFQGLGDLSGGANMSMAYDVSGDGSVVVGQSTSASGDEAFSANA